MHRVSAYILTFNEAEKIADAIKSVSWADEVLVVDSNSTDNTVKIAESLGARVVQVKSRALVLYETLQSKLVPTLGFLAWTPTSFARLR